MSLLTLDEFCNHFFKLQGSTFEQSSQYKGSILKSKEKKNKLLRYTFGVYYVSEIIFKSREIRKLSNIDRD